MKITTQNHGFESGDWIAIHRGNRWKTLLWLLRRPRIQFVTDTTSTSFSVGERRMTWREWRAELWRVLSR